jgi:phosphate transport system protein
MPRTVFDEGLKAIQDETLLMGSMTVKAIHYSMKALQNRDLELAQRIIDNDADINEKRFEIEEKCIQLMATQQPMASDLRLLVAVQNIIVDLERIADYAVGTARIVIMIGDEPPLKPLVDLPRMSEVAQDMLMRSLDAFIKRDVDAARALCKEDDEVDGLYDQVFQELLGIMAEDPGTITRATRLIWVAHNLERSADRTTNICERTVFAVTGKLEEIGASKY